MQRRRHVLGPETRTCVVCDGARRGVVYDSWTPAGRFSRRRLDVRRRWQCLECGTRGSGA